MQSIAEIQRESDSVRLCHLRCVANAFCCECLVCAFNACPHTHSTEAEVDLFLDDGEAGIGSLSCVCCSSCFVCVLCMLCISYTCTHMLFAFFRIVLSPNRQSICD